MNIPESLLDAADVVDIPVLLGDILLTNRDAGPGHAHLSDAVDIVLVELDLQRAEVTRGPLGKTPLLLNQGRGLELGVLAGDVSVEDGELSAHLSALKLARGAASESSNALGVGEGVVQLLSRGAELVRSGHGSSVDRNLLGGGSGGGCRGRGFLLGSLRVVLGSSESAGRVDARSVLEVLAVLSNESGTKLAQSLSELRNELGANQVLHGLLGRRIRVVFNLKLKSHVVNWLDSYGNTRG